VAISHPHFYNASATIFATLLELLPPAHVAPSARVFASARDREWWTHGDTDAVEWVEEDVRVLAPGLTFVRCGGHFPGSAVLHWDRAAGAGEDGTHLPRSGVLLCSDTVMVAPDRRTVSFMWSVPNLVRSSSPVLLALFLMPDRAQLPLSGVAVQAITAALRPYEFEDAYSAWPDRELAGGAKESVLAGARRFLQMEGWAPGQFNI
jgi:hypothetical protein